MQIQRIETAAALVAVEDARAAWNSAPLHVRTMAGAYVGPLLFALEKIAEALEAGAANAGR